MSLIMEDPDLSSSTPLKEKNFKIEQSVEDLLHVIDSNISSASLHEQHRSNSISSQESDVDGISPIKPLNLKQQVQQQQQSLNSILASLTPIRDTNLHQPTNQNDYQDILNDTNNKLEILEKVMEDIPRAPSFDELDFNTKINRSSSLSRLPGPRQMSKSALRETSSNKSSPKKLQLLRSSSVDNSPSKKSVCFEESPPKILEYEELTPDNSNEESAGDDTFESKWKINLSSHPLPPPPPPKHVISTATSPQKETSIGSNSDESQDLNLTREDLQAHSLSLEKKLDLVLNNDEISKRVQYDESFKGSGSPTRLKPTREEEDILYLIKNKDQVEKEETIALAHSLFEEDLRNNDKNSNTLKLDPIHKRRGSASSLKDEERDLNTQVVSTSEHPITLPDGMRNADAQSLSQMNEGMVSQSTIDTFESATEIIEDSSLESLVNKSTGGLVAKDSTRSISTLRNEPMDFVTGHSKKNSFSDSVQDGLSLDRSRESPSEIEVETPDNEDDLQTRGFKDIDVGKGSLAVNTDRAEPTGHSSSFILHQSSPSEEPLSSAPSTPKSQMTESEHEPSLGSIESQSNFQLEPPIPLPAAFQSDENDVSLTDELKESDVFNVALKDVLPSSSSFDSNAAAEPDQDNEEIVEGYRSLSPKKKAISGPARKNSPALEDPEAQSKPEAGESPTKIRQNGKARVNTTEGTETVADLEQSKGSNSNAEVVNIDTETIDSKSRASSPTPPILNESAGSNSGQLQSSFNDHESATISEPDFSNPLDEEFNHQTNDIQSKQIYESLNPSTTQSPQVKSTLPSFNSLLFHDKEPVDQEDTNKRPLDYITIWHSQPIAKSPNPQYSVRQRKLSPPKRVLKLLERTLKDEYDTELEDTSAEEIRVKKEHTLEPLRDVWTGKSTFVARSVSRSSFIDLDSSSRRSSLLELTHTYSRRSSLILPTSESKRASIHHPDSFETSGLDLPNISNSSDFGNAFDGWDLSAPTPHSNDKPTVKSLNFDTGNIKSIWGSDNQSSSPAPTTPVDHGMLRSMLEKSSDGDMLFKNQEITSRVIVGNNQGLGIDIEFDQESQFNIFEDKEEKEEISNKTPAHAGPKNSKESLYQKSKFKFVSSTKTSPIKVDVPIPIAHVDHDKLLSKQRQISGASQGSGFDLNSEFDKLVQLQDHKYAVREKKEVVVAHSDFEADISLNKEDVDNDTHCEPRYATLIPIQKIRTPLTDLNETRLNSQVIPQPRQVKAHSQSNSKSYNRIISAANSETDKSVIDAATELNVKKRNDGLRVAKSQQSLVPELSNNDQGRLYIHINSLRGFKLDEIKAHKATFKLYLDNGKHKISTPKLDLDATVPIDKEFEMAVEDESTDLFLTLKVDYIKPENELVEVVERVPITNPNRLSRLFGIKPKYKREMKFVSRKRLVDSWDNLFAIDGSFGKNKITFNFSKNDITGMTKDYTIELFNEWTTREQDGKVYKMDPYLVAKLDVSMLFIPRTSPLESLPPTIKVANSIVDRLIEQGELKFEGFLYQEGGDCELWKRRWFTIEGTKLTAHNETTKKPRSQINLLKVVDIIHSGKKNQRDGKRNITEEILMSDTFKLSFKNGEIISFNAETKENKEDWIAVLERVVGFNKFHQPWSKLLAEKKKETTSCIN